MIDGAALAPLLSRNIHADQSAVVLLFKRQRAKCYITGIQISRPEILVTDPALPFAAEQGIRRDVIAVIQALIEESDNVPLVRDLRLVAFGYIEVPEEGIRSLGSGKKPAVRVTIRRYAYRTKVGVMGGIPKVKSNISSG